MAVCTLEDRPEIGPLEGADAMLFVCLKWIVFLQVFCVVQNHRILSGT